MSKKYDREILNDDDQSEDVMNIFTMIDEEGIERDFEFLGQVFHLGDEYLLLGNLEEMKEYSENLGDSEDEILITEILKVGEDENGDEYFESVTNEDDYKTIMDIFLQENPDDYTYYLDDKN